jgi:endonuclease/exonuclease/phosphatase family metal-dependent hydrolase
VSKKPIIRIASYNVHKCRGLDRRVRPDRIARILGQLNADVIAVQEVIGASAKASDINQARFLADALAGYTCHFGENRRIRDAAYGNAILSRLPVRFSRNYDLSCRAREHRGCLRVDVEAPPGVVLHVFNVHLGTGFMERRRQARMLISDTILRRIDLEGPSVVVGDFNEWTRGLASRLMSQHYEGVDLHLFLRRTRTYPGVIPFLHLDHFYFDRRLELERFELYRTRESLVASDHLPIVADFRLRGM